jgi:uncharacterized protein
VTLATALLVVGCVVTGAALQRVAGMGLGMVVAPVLSVILGPLLGVTMSNVAATVTAGMLLAVLWRDVDWGRFARVAPLLLVGSVAGAWMVRVVSTAVLDVVLGASVLIAIAAVLGLQRHLNAQGHGVALTAGAAAGFMNAVSGVGGPALTVYAVASRWGQRAMAATLQPVFLLVNISAVVFKVLVGAVPPTDLVPWWGWLLLVAAAPVGVVLGGLAAGRVSAGAARRVTIAVASTGAAVALVRGLVGLAG